MEFNNDYIKNLQYSLDKLKFHQQQEVLQILNQFFTNNNISPIFKSEEYLDCPHCSSISYVKNGMREGKQRYKCKDCGLSFTSTSNTAIHYKQNKNLDKWVDFVYLMFKSPVPPTLMVLSEKLSISTKTAHEWKHKLLASLNETESIVLRGKIEMDEVFLPFCVKGKRGNEKTTKIIRQEDKLISEKKNTIFLCVHNREKDFDFFPVKIQQKGQIKAEILKPIIDGLNIEPNTLVITDMGKASTSYFKDRSDVRHKTFNSGEKVKNSKKGIKSGDSEIHNNNINTTMSLYSKWSKNFGGYSTKYIWNYLKWFRFHRKFVANRNLELMVDYSVRDVKSHNRYILIPKYYEKFLFTA